MNSSKTKGTGDHHYPSFVLATLAKLQEPIGSKQLFSFMNSNEFLWLLEFGFVHATVGELELLKYKWYSNKMKMHSQIHTNNPLLRQ